MIYNAFVTPFVAPLHLKEMCYYTQGAKKRYYFNDLKIEREFFLPPDVILSISSFNLPRGIG